jgi:ribosomal protein S18 acetylase RimI-like enzyme
MVTRTDVKIVEARAEHAPFIAWVILTAQRSHLERGFWDHFLGGSEERVLRYLEALTTTEQPHWVHHTIFLVAEVDGRPAAALSGYFKEELRSDGQFERGMVLAVAATGIMPEADAMARATTMLQVSAEHVPGAWIIESVATAPEFRRQGLIDQLMEAILERGRERGASVSDISVLIENDAAQRAYEKAGFNVISEKRHPEFEAVYGTPGIRLLRRGL